MTNVMRRTLLAGGLAQILRKRPHPYRATKIKP